MESDSEDVGPSYAAKLADTEVEKLHSTLENILSKSPSIKKGQL